MGNSQQVLADLERYDTDVAVLAGLYDRPELLAREYARHAIVLFAHVAHPFARRSEIALSELQGQPLLLREHGSPVNLHDFSPLARNAGELVEAAGSRGLTCRVFVARKANKSLGLVDAATAAGHGIDVASLREIFERTGALSYVEHLVAELSDQAFAALDALELDAEPASMLRALGYAAVERRA